MAMNPHVVYFTKYGNICKISIYIYKKKCKCYSMALIKNHEFLGKRGSWGIIKYEMMVWCDAGQHSIVTVITLKLMIF